MTAETLPRVTFEGLTLDDERTNLANQAAKKLGYNKLAQAISSPGALLYKLRELEIQPLITSYVEDYKQSKEYTGMYSGTKKVLWWGAIAAAAATAFVAGITNDVHAAWSTLHCTYIFATGAFTVSSIIRLFIIGDEVDSGARKVRRWQTYPISSYPGNIPEFALAKAVAIADAFPLTYPRVDFQVEQLVTEDQHRRKPVRFSPDPFLVAILGNERYYLDVWDEEEYETRM